MIFVLKKIRKQENKICIKIKAKIWGQTRVLHRVILYQKPRSKKKLTLLKNGNVGLYIIGCCGKKCLKFF